MTDDNTDTTIDDLEEELEEQKQINEGLAEKLVELSGLLPETDRRKFLKTGAGAAALVAAGAVGQASATPGDDGDTVWGTDSNRDDYYADEIDANLVNTGDIDIDNKRLATPPTLSPSEPLSDVSATSYTTIANLSGAADLRQVPSNATAYGLFVLRSGSLSDVTRVKPRVYDINGNGVFLDELVISSQENSTLLTSGYQELTSVDGLVTGGQIDAEVDSGTSTFTGASAGVFITFR